MKAIIQISNEPDWGYSQRNWSESCIQELQEYARLKKLELTGIFMSPLNDIWSDSDPATIKIKEILENDPQVTLLRANSPQQLQQSNIADSLQNKLMQKQKLLVVQLAHPCFPPPKTDETRIWRYLDLPKFLDLIKNSCLHFTRADDMQKFEPHDGRPQSKMMKTQLDEIENGIRPCPEPTMSGAQFAAMMRPKPTDETLMWSFINCWHISPSENFAMWKIYSEKFGVSIESNFELLRASFSDERWGYYETKHKIFAGKVTYYDDESDPIPQGNIFWRYMFKRNEFAYEKELRCMILNSEKPNVVRPKIVLKKLIVAVHVSPFAPSWFEEVVRNICEKYELGSNLVFRSKLSI